VKPLLPLALRPTDSPEGERTRVRARRHVAIGFRPFTSTDDDVKASSSRRVQSRQVLSPLISLTSLVLIYSSTAAYGPEKIRKRRVAKARAPTGTTYSMLE